jgi:hypothetical protein
LPSIPASAGQDPVQPVAQQQPPIPASPVATPPSSHRSRTELPSLFATAIKHKWRVEITWLEAGSVRSVTGMPWQQTETEMTVCVDGNSMRHVLFSACDCLTFVDRC